MEKAIKPSKPGALLSKEELESIKDKILDTAGSIYEFAKVCNLPHGKLYGFLYGRYKSNSEILSIIEESLRNYDTSWKIDTLYDYETIIKIIINKYGSLREFMKKYPEFSYEYFYSIKRIENKDKTELSANMSRKIKKLYKLLDLQG